MKIDWIEVVITWLGILAIIFLTTLIFALAIITWKVAQL